MGVVTNLGGRLARSSLLYIATSHTPVNKRRAGALRSFWCTWAGLRWARIPYEHDHLRLSFGAELLRHLLPLIPAGLLIEQVLSEPDRVVILSRPKSPTSVCPLCGAASAHVHSRYQCTLADLPW